MTNKKGHYMQFSYRTERLILQALNEDNALLSQEFYQKGSEVFNKVEPPKSPEFYTLSYQKSLLKGEFESFLRGGYYRFYLTTLEDRDTIIGTVSFSHIDRGAYRSAILGYKLLPEHQKKGYALEAITRLITAIFEEEKMHRIEAFVLRDNQASINLLTRIGFECEGIARSVIKLTNGFTDHLRYVLINPMD